MMDSKGSKDKTIYLAFIHVNKYGVSAWQAEKSDPDTSLRWGQTFFHPGAAGITS